MDGNIFNTKGKPVGSVLGSSIFDLSGKKLYELKGPKSIGCPANSSVT
jgi:hypothetical protein